MTESRAAYAVTPIYSAELSGRVMDILRQAKSAGLRVTGRELAARLEEKNDRRIRQVIAELIARGELIAASNEAPMGYYLIESADDARRYEVTLRSRAVQTLRRLADFRKSVARKFGIIQQLPLPTLGKAIEELEQ